MHRITGAVVKAGAALAVCGAAAAFSGMSSLLPGASNQGYAPVQPIPFSHKIHAGENGIDCRYCHSAVTKSRHATVPPVAVCLNCHSVVKKDSPSIRKIQESQEDLQTADGPFAAHRKFAVGDRVHLCEDMDSVKAVQSRMGWSNLLLKVCNIFSKFF
jgi:hypothetical protein